MPRDEEAIVCRQIELVLNGQTHTVNVRSIRENRVLRRRVGEMLAATQGEDVIGSLLGVGADVLMELPVLYAPELEEACAAASDEELIEAGKQVMELILPFIRATLGGMTELAQRLAG